jgi:hypothetical protein
MLHQVRQTARRQIGQQEARQQDRTEPFFGRTHKAVIELAVFGLEKAIVKL